MEITNTATRNMENFERLLEKVSHLSENDREKVCIFAQGVLAGSENHVEMKGA